MQTITGYQSSLSTYYSGSSDTVYSYRVEAAIIGCCPQVLNWVITHTATDGSDTRTISGSRGSSSTHFASNSGGCGCLYAPGLFCAPRKVTRFRASLPDVSGLCGGVIIKAKFCLKVFTNDDCTGTQYDLV